MQAAGLRAKAFRDQGRGCRPSVTGLVSGSCPERTLLRDLRSEPDPIGPQSSAETWGADMSQVVWICIGFEYTLCISHIIILII